MCVYLLYTCTTYTWLNSKRKNIFLLLPISPIFACSIVLPTSTTSTKRSSEDDSDILPKRLDGHGKYLLLFLGNKMWGREKPVKGKSKEKITILATANKPLSATVSLPLFARPFFPCFFYLVTLLTRQPEPFFWTPSNVPTYIFLRFIEQHTRSFLLTILCKFFPISSI